MNRYLALITILAAPLFAGCTTPPAESAAAPPATAAAAAAPTSATSPAVHDGRAIEITGNDSMKFSVTEIAARPGERLSVTLVNDGTTPKFSMGHNWVLLAGGVDLDAFVVAAAEAVTTDYVPRGDQASKMLATTRLLGPGERDTATFTAPTTPGRYEFICSFPGHYQVGMRGVLIVG